MARLGRLELPTAGLEGRCSIQLSYRRFDVSTPNRRTWVQFGRGRGIRTHDPLLPKQVRYQTALCPAPVPLAHAWAARIYGPE